MATLTQIREGLAANLSSIKGCQISAYPLDDPSPPTLQVNGPDVVEFDLAMRRGLDDWTMVVQGFTGAPEERGKYVTLDKWLEGSTGVKNAIESDITLGGIVHGARVTRIEAYRDFQLPHGGRVLFGALWFIQVFSTA